MAGKVEVNKGERPPVKQHDIKMLDLAFAMDCTGSMGEYIDSARDNIRQIVEEIVASEKGDVRLALVNYRDHPPQDTSYVTEVHDFTSSPNTMKGWLTNTSADGGGDTPEAVADALHDVLKLSWRDEATKICVCISDAPPHGLPGCGGDGFPEGCPAGIDPIKVVREMAEKGITLYVAGCEPSISPYKNFFMAIAYITGGQYVPLSRAKVLSQVIVGGAQEEMSLEQIMEEVNEEVQADMASGRTIDEEEMSRRVHTKMMAKGIRSKQMFKNNANLTSAGDVPMANALSKLDSYAAVQAAFKPEPSSSSFGGFGAGGAPYMAMRMCAPPPGAMSCPMPASVRMESLSLSAPAPEEDESYECRESEVTLDQASRMVKKSLARNKIGK